MALLVETGQKSTREVSLVNLVEPKSRVLIGMHERLDDDAARPPFAHELNHAALLGRVHRGG